ncbi:exodeoxyribonuclease VII large subunit [bacterium]|nr:exodeoxyribonuclease VII large subunit [bacterium]
MELLPQVNEKVYTVSEITGEVKRLIEGKFPLILVKGEISNFKRHSSGHIYFTLKDNNAQLSCVMWKWRNAHMRFILEDGMAVIAGGNMTLYEKQGKYQLDVETIHPLGIGELQLAFDKLKKKLEKEGLFDSQYKNPLPRFPWRIGVVTSPTGAAIRDIVSVIGRRSPQTQIIINPVRVQGEGASAEISAAIKEFNEYGEVDLIIVGRGGGSLEDLWAFNEEITARAIFDSKIPVLSAVGHEIDFSISDFVADYRAPTPSAAGEIAVPNKADLEDGILQTLKRLYKYVTDKIETEKQKIRSIESSYALGKPYDLYKQYVQTTDELSHRLEVTYKHFYSLLLQNVIQYEERLKSLDPHAVLKRGYSICYRQLDGKIILSSKELKIDDGIKIKFSEGTGEGNIKKLHSS